MGGPVEAVLPFDVCRHKVVRAEVRVGKKNRPKNSYASRSREMEGDAVGDRVNHFNGGPPFQQEVYGVCPCIHTGGRQGSVKCGTLHGMMDIRPALNKYAD